MYVEVCIDTHGVIHVPTHIVHDEVWVVTATMESPCLARQMHLVQGVKD